MGPSPPSAREKWERGSEALASSRLLREVAAGFPVDPERWLSDEELILASRHGLLGIMAASDSYWLAEAARVPYARLAARQLVMERVLQRLLASLAGEGIRTTVVKGPALARWAYANPQQRTYSDLDLLVPADQVMEAVEVIRSDPATLGVPPKTPKADKRNIPMVDPSGIGFTLDLHWDLFSHTQLRGSARGAVDEGWERAEFIPGHTLGPMWKLPDEILIAFLATHAVLDHRFRLILFRDLAELAHNGIDWDGLLEFSSRHRLRALSYAAWSIASSTVAAPIPAVTLKALRPRCIAVAAMDRILPRSDLVHFDGHRPHILNLAIVLLHDLPGTRARLMLAAPLSFPRWLKRVEGHGNAPTPARRRRRTKVTRVLHVLPVDIARGAQTYAKAMRDSLDSKEVQHRTTTIFRSEPVALHADVDLGAKPGLSRRLGFSISALLRLRTHIRKWRPEVVVAHGGEALKYSALAATPATRIVYYKIGTSSPFLRNPLRKWIHRMLIKRADLVAAVSMDMIDEAQTLLRAPADRTILVPNGRDPALFWELAAPGRSGPVRFLFVGYLTESKRPDRFVDAVTTLIHRGVDAQGIVIGDGPLLRDLRRTIPVGVRFLGHRDDVPSQLAQGDVFLFTSNTEGEGMPGVLIEAGLAGLPVVSTDVPGASTIIDDGVTGFVVGVNDGLAFIDAAERLARDPELREAMGAAARQRCLEKFTLDSSTEIWRRQLTRL